MWPTNLTTQYLTCSYLPGDSFLRTCAAGIQLSTDREHLEFVEIMIREGVPSVLEKCFLKANNTFFDQFNPNRGETHGILVDFKNFYLGIMEKLPLPLEGFRKISLIDLQEMLDTPIESELVFFFAGRDPLSGQAA